MQLPRMDNVLIVVEDLEKAKAFYGEIGLELEAQMVVEGPWVDACIGIENAKSEIAMMKTPDGNAKIELTKFHQPAAVPGVSNDAPANTLGIRRVMFQVEDVDDLVARLRKHGAELVDRIVNYENVFRLCYVRGPEGIIVGLAQKIG